MVRERWTISIIPKLNKEKHRHVAKVKLYDVSELQHVVFLQRKMGREIDRNGENQPFIKNTCCWHVICYIDMCQQKR